MTSFSLLTNRIKFALVAYLLLFTVCSNMHLTVFICHEVDESIKVHLAQHSFHEEQPCESETKAEHREHSHHVEHALEVCIDDLDILPSSNSLNADLQHLSVFILQETMAFAWLTDVNQYPVSEYPYFQLAHKQFVKSTILLV